MQLHGKQIIGSHTSSENDHTYTGFNPAIGQAMDTKFHQGTIGEVDRALKLANEVFNEYRRTTVEQRATFLEAIADQVMELGDALLEQASAETGLPMGRCTGERGRAVNQAKLFANVVREGSWVDARIDLPLPDRAPLPKPDIRSKLMPLGPVVVFGASNFPLAISVVGSDPISAFGAGCPVVVKAHPAHPGTCEMLARAVAAAVEQCGLPAGIFSLIHGTSNDIGRALVEHPLTRAVAFTGSLAGGRALYDVATSRPDPIPFYAEMGSTNPVFILPGALKERGEQIAEGYIGSVNLGVGQFCTNPGLVLGLKGDPLEKFVSAASEFAGKAAPATMLHAGIHQSFQNGVDRIGATAGVNLAGKSETEADPAAAQAACTIFSTDVPTFDANPHLTEEVFGPVSIVISADQPEQLIRIARELSGHLTATIHGTRQDLADHRELVEILETKVGRIVFNGFPTGIEVCASMHHGGPYPATTDAHFTSIGTGSILRFGRPICYQGFPQEALPAELQNKNSAGVWRLIDNERSKDDAG